MPYLQSVVGLVPLARPTANQLRTHHGNANGSAQDTSFSVKLKAPVGDFTFHRTPESISLKRYIFWDGVRF
jgi:hypothetical protein